MGKILIIDDRAERKKSLMSGKDLSKLSEFEQEKTICLRSSLPFSSKSSITEIEEAFEHYSVIAIHRSLMQTENVINLLEDYFRTHNKSFIIFSGGTSVNDFSNSGMRLSINAGDFYSTKLIDFIEKQKNANKPIPLLELLYGRSWRLPLLLQYRNLLWCGRMTDEDEDRLRRAIDPTKQDTLSLEFINAEIETEKINFVAL